LGLAFVFFVFFAASLRAHLRQTPEIEALSALVLAGEVLETAGQTSGAGYIWALAQDSSHLDPSAALGLNALNNDAVITNTAGSKACCRDVRCEAAWPVATEGRHAAATELTARGRSAGGCSAPGWDRSSLVWCWVGLSARSGRTIKSSA
jgi:hypothetical protein